jgi:rhodanese-related sulfurtransferase
MRAALRLVELGYRNVFEYPGGLDEWSRAIGPLATTDEAPAHG